MKRPGTQQKIFTELCVFALAFVSLSFAGTDVKTIDTAQLRSMVVENVYELEAGRQGQFTIIDARPREEYERAHIFSAVSIPENNFETYLMYLPADKNTLLVVYCNSLESGTSGRWAEKAKSAGYTNIIIYADSFSVWKEKHLPILPFKSVR
jgi:rhodanese-related sulfurtransferase